MTRRCALTGPTLPISKPPAQTAPLRPAQAAPHTFGLIGRQGVLQTFILHRTDCTNGLGGRDRRCVFPYRKEETIVRAGAGSFLAPILLRLKKQIVECQYHVVVVPLLEDSP